MSNMLEKLAPLYIFILSIVSFVQALQHGAPTSACHSLKPVHRGAEAQRTTAPYKISAIKENNKIKVTISSDVGEEVAGFVIQARLARDKNKIVQGTFTIKDGITKTIDCPGGKYNTLTHVDPSPKRMISTEWSPTETIDSDIIFRGSIAKSYMVYYSDVDSTPIHVKSSSVMGQTQSQQKNSPEKKLYHNCFVSRGCFGYPAGCIPIENCTFILSYKNIDGGVAFQMKGIQKKETYMAFALSEDTQMGDDAVMECLMRDSGAPIMRESYNEGRSNKNTRDIPRSAYSSEIEDEMATCSWNETFIKESNGKTFNLLNSTYFILLAKGPIRDGGIYYHDGRLSSQQGVNFTAFDVIASGGIDDMIKIHGCLMTTAWVAFVSFAILVARHFKTAFDDKTLFGTKIWFCIHRALMIASIVLIIIGLIVIFVYNKGWNDKLSNPHPILGLIASVMALCQPIIAAFRPSPDSSKRPYFNVLHFCVGNLAQFIAVVTIFYAVPLESSGLDGSFNWVMSIFVVVHILFHILFQIQAWTLGKNKNEVKMIEMNSRISNNTQNAVPDKKLGANVFSGLLLGIYGIFLIAILLAMYVLIGVK